jgi:hypothetical protein
VSKTSGLWPEENEQVLLGERLAHYIDNHTTLPKNSICPYLALCGTVEDCYVVRTHTRVFSWLAVFHRFAYAFVRCGE